MNTQGSNFGQMEPLDKSLWELRNVEKLMKETTSAFLQTDLERENTSSNSLSPVSKDLCSEKKVFAECCKLEKSQLHLNLEFLVVINCKVALHRGNYFVICLAHVNLFAGSFQKKGPPQREVICPKTYISCYSYTPPF